MARNDKPWKKGDDSDADDDDRPRKRRRPEPDEDEFDDEFDDWGGEDDRRSRADLREIAGRQRGIIMCILAYFVLGGGQFAVPEDVRMFVLIPLIPVVITAAVFVILLAVKLYGTGSGVVYGILTLVPLVGLIVLLIINQKATKILTDNGVRVGLLGANSSDL